MEENFQNFSNEKKIEKTKMSLIESQGELESNYPTENTA